MIIEGETGVGKTALVEMLSKLWNQSLLNQWRKKKDQILEFMRRKLGDLTNSDATDDYMVRTEQYEISTVYILCHYFLCIVISSLGCEATFKPYLIHVVGLTFKLNAVGLRHNMHYYSKCVERLMTRNVFRKTKLRSLSGSLTCSIPYRKA